MNRDLFDRIFDFEVGKIFLLNLADSLELKLVDKASYELFRVGLEGCVERVLEGWWRNPMRAALLASKRTELGGGERFASVAALTLSQVKKIDPLRELAGDEPEPGRFVEDIVLQAFFNTRLHKKTYWLTDLRSLGRAASADAVRDRLGLDWVGDDMYLYRIDMRRERVAAVGPSRPSALCDGTARFRARRSDEDNHQHYAGWGRTVELAAWRNHRKGAALAGAAELIAGIGPLAAGDGQMSYLGRTMEPSHCSDDVDHRRFAEYLNGGSTLDADSLHRRLIDLEGNLS